MKPHTHAYGEGDEQEGNDHEHGMTSAQMAAMFAANRQAGPGKRGIAKPGTKANPGQKLGGERANLMTVVRSKPHTPDMARKTKPAAPPKLDGRSARPKASPKITDGTRVAKPAASKAHAPTTGHSAKPHAAPHAKPHAGGGGHGPGGHEGGHGPLGVMRKIGGAVKEAGHEAKKAVIASTGQEPTAAALHSGAKGHKFGDPREGRHEDH